MATTSTPLTTENENQGQNDDKKWQNYCRKNLDNIMAIILIIIYTVSLSLFSNFRVHYPSTDGLGDINIEETQYADLFNIFESAILSSKSNEIRLRRAFFKAPNVDPVFLKIVYTLSFSENITELTSGYCGDYNASSVEEYNIYLGKIYTNKTGRIIYGWSSTGIYAAIHPSLLNWMQLQLPLAFLRLAHRDFNAFIVGEDSPVTDMFLWDTSYDLPTVYLNLTIDYLPCLPSNEFLGKLLGDITTLVKFYASGDSHKTKEKTGFALDERSTSTYNVIFYGVGGYFVLCNWILAVVFALLLVIVLPNFKKDNFNSDSKPVRQVIIVVNFIHDNIHKLIFTAIIEVITEFIGSIVWSLNTDRFFIAVIWVILIIKIIPLVMIFFCMFCKLHTAVAFSIGYVCTYHALPTFLFLLVFPTQVIALYLYFIAKYVALLLIFKHMSTFGQKIISKINDHKKQSDQKNIYDMVGILMTLFISMFTIFSGTLFSVFLMLILYTVAVGKTSVITASFFGFLPLLPTVVIVGIPLFLSKTGTQKAKHSSTDDADKKDNANENDMNKHTEQSGLNARIDCTNAYSIESEV